MASRCCWPNQPALPIGRNRNGSQVRRLGAGYPRRLPSRARQAVRSEADRVLGHYAVVAVVTSVEDVKAVLAELARVADSSEGLGARASDVAVLVLQRPEQACQVSSRFEFRYIRAPAEHSFRTPGAGQSGTGARSRWRCQ